jgi:hypothetical protein
MFVHDLTWYLGDIAMIYHHWTWALLVSPAAYICFAALIALAAFPFAMLKGYNGIEAERPSVNFLPFACFAVLAFVVLKIIAWASFPIGFDAEGYQRMRLTPLMPWPDRPFPPIF